jgi:phosphoglycolate phosphatase
MKFKGIIFDLDGTLVNSIEDIADSMNTVLHANNYPTHSYEAYKYFIGSGIRNLAGKALPDTHNDEKLINSTFNSMMEVYRDNCINKTKPYDGIIEMLDELLFLDLKLSVLSNKSDEFTKKITHSLFPNYFEYVEGLSIETNKKPNPYGALEISKDLGIDPKDIIYVGDTGIDMQTANNANMYGIGVLWGFRPKEELISNGAKHIINNPLDLIEIL